MADLLASSRTVSGETSPGAITNRADRVARAYRLVAPVVLVAASPLVPGVTADACVHFGLFVAFGWLPLSGFVTMVESRHPGRASSVFALVVDVVLLFLVQDILQPGALAVVLATLVLVAYYTHVHGRRLGIVAGAMAGSVTIGFAIDRVASLDGFTLALYPFALISLGWLLDVAATERGQARAGLIRLHDKSDAILSGIAEAVVVTSATGRVEQHNPAAARTFGWGADVVGRPCATALGLWADVREFDCSTGCPLLALPLDAGDADVWRWVGPGQRQPLLASVAPVVDENGTVVEVVHSFRDITRIKAADEAKTLFLATASHELKTPLTVIRGFSQLLLTPGLDLGADDRRTALTAIDIRAAQLTGIVDRLLMSSRIESGRIELALTPVAIEPILRERVEALDAATGRIADLDAAADLPDALVDRDAFTTVVDHLLDNAVKYSPNGGPITVGVGADDGRIILTVSDEGVGMTEEHLAHCFDRFWQAEATDVRRFGGTGLGLYIVRSLVEGMGGRVDVASRPGEGSAFTVTVRRADRATIALVIEPEAPPTGHGEPSMIREFMRQLGVPVEPRA
jgi:signal transduction histidine kinase